MKGLATEMSRDVPGNSVASEVEFQRMLRSLGEALLRFENAADTAWNDGRPLGNVTIKLKGDQRGDYLLIARRRSEGVAEVAFVSGDTFAEVLKSFVNGLRNGSLKWKVDAYG